MKQLPQYQSPAAILRAEIESWRTSSRMSREAVAIAIVEAHQALGADLATEISFEFEGDTFAKARKSAQKIFRWLDEGNLPANLIPSILEALPAELKIRCLSQMFCPVGVEVRAVDHNAPAELDVPTHLRAVMKESSEAQLALVNLAPNASTEMLLAVHKELVESAQASENAARDVMATLAARQAVADPATSSK